MDELAEPRLLKKYLLGTLDDEIVQGRIEERLMLDEEFGSQVGVAEDELIEEFLDDELSPDESDKFNRFFLAPPERKRQLRLTRDLRRVSASKTALSPHQPRSQFDRFFSIGWLRFAAAAAVLVLAALGVWRFAIYQSDTERGLEALQAAYRDQRPIESRITAFPSYAPYPQTRGKELRVTDAGALDRADRLLGDASGDQEDAAAHHAYAMYYLAGRDLERAQREITIALKASANDARVQNDAGAVYLEIAKKANDDKDSAGEFVALNEGLKHFNLALTLDAKLMEARFNRALALGELGDTEETKAAWREYLEFDSDPRWTEEAKRHLEKLERDTPQERSAEQLEIDFMAAFRAGNDDEAKSLIGNNRELIQDKYLPTRLAMSLVLAPDDRRNELLRALVYSGEIEMKSTGDPFAREIARFYRISAAAQREKLKRAHEDLRAGIIFCREDANYKEALPLFVAAQKTFDDTGDLFSGKIAQYFVGYAMVNLKQNDEALENLNQVEAWARERKFAWLRMTALHWVGSCLLNRKAVTDARRAFENALSLADHLDDSYAKQRNLSLLAHLHSLCGQEKAALKYLFTAVKESNKPETSLRQRYRNLFFVFPILFRAGLFSAGKPAAMEVIRIADQQNDKMWAAQSRAFAGIASLQTGDMDTAERLLQESRVKASEIAAPETRDRVTALANLRSADFERMRGNLDAAERFYSDSLRYYDSSPREPLLREEAHHGLLLTYLEAKKSQALEGLIPQAVKEAEEYRSRILDEDQSIGFFELKGNIYDIAAELRFDNGDLERAYDYAETSSSRSLLDRMQRKANNSPDPSDRLASGALTLGEIRAALPPNVQIVQYSVFERKTVIWLVSREGFKSATIPVDAKELAELVSEFARTVSDQSTAASAETRKLGAELHRLLIRPILADIGAGEKLCIIPSKFLFDLPFAAVIDNDGKPLISTFELITAPSANVFVLASRNAASREGEDEESLLAVGNPAFDRKRYEDLEYLPDSEKEVDRLSKLYLKAKTLRHGEATKDALLEALPEADVVHVASHYVAMPGTPMSSFLLLAANGEGSGELSNLELANVSIPKARLIVLAACRSGIESYYRSEGMAGMSRTMLAAQVPLVVASQWSVDSDATADLMVRFHELRRQRMSTTAALRQAQLDFLNDPTARFSSPYYWAAFALYGGHADF